MEERKYFVYKLIPPRPSFAADMSEEEAAIMAAHSEYWRARMGEGHVLVFGPVAGPEGAWGLGVIAADSEDQARELADADPAITSRMATCAIEPMLGAVFPQVLTG